MAKLSPNKTGVYRLVKEYSPYPVPKMKDCEYVKAQRCSACWLHFNSEDEAVKAYLDVCMGEILLRIECKGRGYDKVFHPDVRMLSSCNLLKEDLYRNPVHR